MHHIVPGTYWYRYPYRYPGTKQIYRYRYPVQINLYWYQQINLYRYQLQIYWVLVPRYPGIYGYRYLVQIYWVQLYWDPCTICTLGIFFLVQTNLPVPRYWGTSTGTPVPVRVLGYPGTRPILPVPVPGANLQVPVPLSTGTGTLTGTQVPNKFTGTGTRYK